MSSREAIPGVSVHSAGTRVRISFDHDSNPEGKSSGKPIEEAPSALASGATGIGAMASDAPGDPAYLSGKPRKDR